MGYSCPVCGDPQADDEHLANHLAFTAMIRGGDHEEFLDEHVPDWESLGEADLGEVVSEMADDEEYPQVFEDTTGHDHAHDHQGHAHGDESEGTQDGAGHDRVSPEDLPVGASRLDGADLDDAPADVLAEAQELTRKRREAEIDDGTETDDGAGTDDGTETDDGAGTDDEAETDERKTSNDDGSDEGE
jgi:hypothetical protein